MITHLNPNGGGPDPDGIDDPDEFDALSILDMGHTGPVPSARWPTYEFAHENPRALELSQDRVVRKDDPSPTDVHVNTPVWSGPKKRKKTKPKSNIRVMRKSQSGGLPLGNEEHEAAFAAALRSSLKALGHPHDQVVLRALQNKPDVYIRALSLEAFSRRMQAHMEGEYVAAALSEAKLRWGDDPLAKSSAIVRFDAVNGAIVKWARKKSAELVTAITNDIREAVRIVITSMYRKGIHPTDAIPLVREALGNHELFPAWSQAVTNYGMRLAEQGDKPDVIKNLTAAYYERLADARANMIARTEIISAQNEGRTEAWEKMVDAGMLSADKVQKKWDASHEGVCPICDELDGETTAIDGLFAIGVPRPPAHPNCRCVVLLVEKK